MNTTQDTLPCDVFFDIHRTLAALDLLADAEDQVRIARKLLAEAMGSDVSDFKANTPEEDWPKLLHFLYWHPFQLSSTAIGNAFGVHPVKVHAAAGPLTFPVTCRDCGKDYEGGYLSRASRQSDCLLDYGRCRNCDRLYRHGTEKRFAETDTNQNPWETREHELSTMPYGEYLLTDEWKTIRSQAYRSAGFRCQLCNKGNCQLNVHHRTYERRGNERYNDLIVLCRQCHETFHDKLSLDPSSYGKETGR